MRHQAIRTVLVPTAAGRNAGDFITLERDHLRHFTKVLRFDWGTSLRIVDGAGGIFEGMLEERNDEGGIILGKLISREEKPLALELGICLPKGATMDWVVEKAVECGATALIPIVSSRSVVRPDPREAEKYILKWQKNADEALEQCERAWRMQVRAPLAWNDLVAKWKACDANFVFVSETRENGSKLFSESWKKIEATAEKSVRICIGPEGGFSEQEREQLVDQGFLELSLGAIVLRVETAVVSALSYFRLARR